MTAREIAALFESLELQLVASLKRNLTRHLAQETDEDRQWPAWQALKLRELSRFRRETSAIAKEYAPQIDAQTRAMLQRQFAEADGSERAFFGVNGKKLEALLNEVTHSEERVQKAALRYMDDVYRKTILRANAAFQAGGVTLQQATDMAVQDFLARGITCVRYSNGRRVNIATYAEMALRTSNTRAALLGDAQKRERLGIDTVLVSQYGECSNTCLPWQGLVYIDDVWQPYAGPHTLGGTYGVSRNGRQYPLLSVAMRGGLFHPNCRHTLTTWIEGVSKRPVMMDKAEVERRSKLETRQRALERKVRECKRLLAGTVEEQRATVYAKRLRAAQAKVREFVARNGDVLRRDDWRERYDGVQESTVADAQRKDGTLYPVTEDAIRTVPRPFFQTLTNNMNAQAQEYAKAVLRCVKNEPIGTEATVSFAADNSTNPMWEIGNAAERRVRVQNMTVPYYSLHNHASNDILSPEDIFALIRHENMRGIGAVGNAGAFYTCEKVYGYHKSKALFLYNALVNKYPKLQVDSEQRYGFMLDFYREAEKYGFSI